MESNLRSSKPEERANSVKGMVVGVEIHSTAIFMLGGEIARAVAVSEDLYTEEVGAAI